VPVVTWGVLQVRGMTMDSGDVVAWYLMGFGSSMDFHPVHYHGQTFIHQSAKKSHRGDVMEVCLLVHLPKVLSIPFFVLSDVNSSF
jgi:hypothetical protein